jgi:hypothetical protein
LLYCVFVATGAPTCSPSALVTTVADGHALAVGEVAAAAEVTSSAAAMQAPIAVVAARLRPIPDNAHETCVSSGVFLAAFTR